MNRIEVETHLSHVEVERAIKLLLKERERAKLRGQRIRAKAREEGGIPPVKEPKVREPKVREPKVKEPKVREPKVPKPRKSRAGIKPTKVYYVPLAVPVAVPEKSSPLRRLKIWRRWRSLRLGGTEGGGAFIGLKIFISTPDRKRDKYGSDFCERSYLH